MRKLVIAYIACVALMMVGFMVGVGALVGYIKESGGLQPVLEQVWCGAKGCTKEK